MFEILILLLIGFIAGIASGIFGIGGGVIFIPTIYFYLSEIGVSPSSITHIVVATSLFAGTLTSISSVFNHLLIKNIDLRKSLLLGSGSVITATIFPLIVVDIDAIILKYIIILLLLSIVVKMLLENNQKEKIILNLKEKYLFPIGLLIGIISATCGIGGGVFFVPILVYFFSDNIKRAVGTSSLTVLMTMLAGSISFALISNNIISEQNQFGYVNYFVGGILGIGAILGAIIGVKLMVRLKSTLIKKIFAIFLIIVIIKMFF